MHEKDSRKMELYSCVRGHHVYKDSWTAPSIKETLKCQRELTNSNNFADSKFCDSSLIRKFAKLKSSPNFHAILPATRGRVVIIQSLVTAERCIRAVIKKKNNVYLLRRSIFQTHFQTPNLLS